MAETKDTAINEAAPAQLEQYKGQSVSIGGQTVGIVKEVKYENQSLIIIADIPPIDKDNPLAPKDLFPGT